MGRATQCATRSPRAGSRRACCGRATSPTTTVARVLPPGRGRRLPVARRGLRPPRARRRSRAARRVVTTTGSALDEVVGDAALLGAARTMPTRSPARSRACSTIPRLAARLRAAGPARAAPFTWERSRRPARRGVPTARDRRRSPAREGAHHRRQRLRRRRTSLAHLRRRGRRRRRRRPLGPDALDITDRDAVATIVRAPRPEVVYHLAALATSASRGPIRPACSRVNVEGTRTCSTRRAPPACGRVLVIGSAEEYGRVDARDLPLARGRAAAPVDAVRREQDRGVVPRVAGVPRVRARRRSACARSATPARASPTAFVVPALAHRIAAAERDERDEIRVGSLDPVRDVSDVRDVVRAYRLLAEHGDGGRGLQRLLGIGRRRCARSPTSSLAPPDRPLAAHRRSRARAPGRRAPPRRRRVAAARRDRLGAGVPPRRDPRRRARRPRAVIDALSRRHALRSRVRQLAAVSGVLVVEPAEQRRDRAGVVAEAVRRRWRRCAARRRAAAASARRRASSTGTTSSALPCTSSHGRGATRRAASTGSRFAIARIHASGSAG